MGWVVYANSKNPNVCNKKYGIDKDHYIDVIMTTVVSQISSLTILYSIVYSGADQRKNQSSASLAFVRGIHRASYAENVFIWWRQHVISSSDNQNVQCIFKKEIQMSWFDIFDA